MKKQASIRRANQAQRVSRQMDHPTTANEPTALEKPRANISLARVCVQREAHLAFIADRLIRALAMAWHYNANQRSTSVRASVGARSRSLARPAAGL